MKEGRKNERREDIDKGRKEEEERRIERWKGWRGGLRRQKREV